MTILEIQQALMAAGFNPGPLDGVWGRRTILAVRAFQAAQGLVPDGIVGPLTLRKLSIRTGISERHTAPEAHPLLVWYEEALRLVGLMEDPSPASNPRLLHMALELNIDYTDDDVPWCGLFTAHCIGTTLPEEQLPPIPLRARNWERFGEAITPVRGAILVFWRDSIASGKGHVGFYHGESTTHFYVLGGNQSNGVNIAKLNKGRFLAARWPRTAATLPSRAVHVDLGVPHSQDEA
ncbi:NlpC/P60 family protein [Indioceanicola profundi]|uniref:NlpC/P60 family protein n=1 Tax=Indioceanicola profundi TaxID=2220096 RepID=UPI000E6AD926|nr:TIGR02594 family protein [Indioceanicola profundi]